MTQLPLPTEQAPAVHQPRVYTPREFKVVSLRECPVVSPKIETPEAADAYWRTHIETGIHHNPEAECFVVLVVNTRRNIKGHILVSIGTMDTLLVHPREVFRPAIVMSGAALILMHNHPSGDPAPSEADIKVTRDLIRAGQLIKIEVLDHVIVGRTSPERVRGWASLRELGYFYSA